MRVSLSKITTLFLVLFSVAAYGQKNGQLKGSWAIYKTSYEGKKNCSNSLSITLSFYRNRFQFVHSPMGNSLNSAGKWKTKDSLLIFKKIDSYSDNEFLFREKREEFKIISCTENELILYHWATSEFFPYERMYFRRVAVTGPVNFHNLQHTKKRKEDSLKKIIEVREDSVTQIALFLTDNNGKKMKINPRGELTMYTKPFSYYARDAEYEIRSFTSINDSTLTFFPRSFKVLAYDSLGISLTRSKHYPKNEVLPYTMKKDDVICFMYSSPVRMKTNRFFARTGWFAFATALFVAPLISIQYKHLGFDKEKYFMVAGSSLSYSILSFSICMSSRSKYYGFGKHQKRKWIMEKLASN